MCSNWYITVGHMKRYAYFIPYVPREIVGDYHTTMRIAKQITRNWPLLHCEVLKCGGVPLQHHIDNTQAHIIVNGYDYTC